MKITADLHVHTGLSSCAKETATAPGYMSAASELGLCCVGFADHMWDENIECPYDWYKPQTFKRISEARRTLISTGEKYGIKILVGCETEYDYAKRNVAITPETASKLDFVLAPVSHTHITMPKEFYSDINKHADYMLNAWYDIMESKAAKYITAIPHPFFAISCPYDNREVMRRITDKQFRDCFTAAKENDIAVEINSKSYKGRSVSQIINDESIRMYSIAKECGCLFTFGSDAHDIPQMEPLSNAYIIASVLELCDKDILSL